jgi:hypothetical protein
MDTISILSNTSFSQASVRNSWEEKQPNYYSPPWRSSNAPSITQLAQSRAQSLEEWSRFSRHGFKEQLRSDNNAEKEKKDSSSTSPATSSMFCPPSNSQLIYPRPDPSPDLPMTSSREYAFIFITCIAQFMSLGALNQTVAPVMVLARHFHIEDYGTLSWFSASFSMSVGTFILPAGTCTTAFCSSSFLTTSGFNRPVRVQRSINYLLAQHCCCSICKHKALIKQNNCLTYWITLHCPFTDHYAGRLGDMYGHKRIYLIGWAWFAIWSLITGFGHSFGVIPFSIFRAFQGIGTSGIPHTCLRTVLMCL